MKFSDVSEKSVLAQKPSGYTDWACWSDGSSGCTAGTSGWKSWDDEEPLGEAEQQGVSGEHGAPGCVPLPTQEAIDGRLAESDGGSREARLQARLAGAEAEPAGRGAAGWMVAGCTLAGQRVSLPDGCQEGRQLAERLHIRCYKNIIAK